MIDLPHAVIRLDLEQEPIKLHMARMLDQARIERIMMKVMDDVVERFDYEKAIEAALRRLIEDSIKRSFSQGQISRMAMEIAEKSVREALQEMAK